MLLLLVHGCYSKERKVVRGWRRRCSKRWRERSTCWEPENPPLFLLLSRLLPSFLKKSPPIYFLSSVLFLLSLLFFFFSSILPLVSIPFSLLSSRFTLCHCSSSIFGRWWCCRWWLGGAMEVLVEVQRWLFSSLFGLVLSLSFPPSLPFSFVLPELLSSQINSPPSFLFSLPSIYKREDKVPPCSIPSWCRGGTGCLTSAG